MRYMISCEINEGKKWIEDFHPIRGCTVFHFHHGRDDFSHDDDQYDLKKKSQKYLLRGVIYGNRTQNSGGRNNIRWDL